ncbi:hypothetical protein F4802DRAFT_188692 [Xylaria palmicola]|nr:hypothetical protein F4802DRAFT_188692 [Xylaria palmicola]
MRFSAGSLLFLGVAAVNGLPQASTESSGCRVDLTPTLHQPQNTASNILYHTLSKWASSTKSSYVSSGCLDTRNTTQAPFSVTFRAGAIPDFQTTEALSGVLDGWLGTYLVGGAEAAKDDYAITGVTCS